MKKILIIIIAIVVCSSFIIHEKQISSPHSLTQEYLEKMTDLGHPTEIKYGIGDSLFILTNIQQ